MKRTAKVGRKPVQNIGKRKYVSRREHALHQFQTRDAVFHPVKFFIISNYCDGFQYLSTLLLGQLYVIDVALRYIRERNDTQREHMISLRGANENNFLFKKHEKSAKKRVILF